MPSLDGISVLLGWTATSVYALAFIFYAVDLATRSATSLDAKDAVVRERELVGAAAGHADHAGAGVIDGVSDRARARAVDSSHSPMAVRPSQRQRHVFARLGTAMVWIGFILHAGSDVLRGIAAGRVPWADMYEFALTGTLIMVAIYLAVLFRYDIKFLGALITGMAVLMLGGALTLYYVPVVPLLDSLRSPWLFIHVTVASAAVAFFAFTFGLSVLQLMQARRERRLIAAAGTDEVVKSWPFLRTLPSSEALESLAYRFAIVGFILWSFTLIAGAIWANYAWGTFWSFDTKEVWTFIVWVLYAGYIHARATRGWRGNRSAWLSIIAWAAVSFNFSIVNVFFHGLHAYSGLTN